MFGQSLLSAFGSAACTTDTDQLFTTDVQTTSLATYQLNNATTSIPSNTYPGTPSNITYAAGKFGNAAVFNGSTSKIGGLPLVNDNTTVSYWFNSSGLTGNRMMFSTHSSGSDGWEVNNPGTNLSFVDRQGLLSNKTGIFSAADSISSGVWYHCAITTTTNQISFYLNGQIVGTASKSTPYTSTNTFFGLEQAYNTYYWGGKIDQVRIFNTALPQSAVTALYNETTTTATYPYVDYVNANPNSVAYYKMSDATDQLANYNGTATNVNFNTEGKFGFAGAFNGSSSQLVKSNFASLSQVGISMWVNIADVNSNYTLIARYGSLKEFAIYNYQASNGFVASIYYNGNNGNAVTITAGDYLTNNTWHHIAFTSDGSTQPKLYIDGVQRGTAQSNNNTYYSTNEDLQIGGGVGRWLNGKIDQIRIYDSALSAENVTALYNEIECPTGLAYLVVAGGGGGGFNYAAGGGAGGLLTNYNNSVAAIPLSLATSYAVTVGDGGSASNSGANRGNNGTNSIFSNIIATGGGGGGSNGASDKNGLPGGSGGGGAGNNSAASTGIGGTATISPTQGNNGGNGFSGSGGAAGGGGGAGSAGGTGSSGQAGAGGLGLANSITGTSTFYAGGGGANANGTNSNGGSSIGGNGGNPATNGVVNTGSGGGGSGTLSGSGGSGIVILRYSTSKVSSFAVTGTLNTPTPIILGTDSVLKFTTGTGTVTFS